MNFKVNIDGIIRSNFTPYELWIRIVDENGIEKILEELDLKLKYKNGFKQGILLCINCDYKIYGRNVSIFLFDEIHGRDFLVDLDDEQKRKVKKIVYDIINESSIELIGTLEEERLYETGSREIVFNVYKEDGNIEFVDDKYGKCVISPEFSIMINL